MRSSYVVQASGLLRSNRDGHSTIVPKHDTTAGTGGVPFR